MLDRLSLTSPSASWRPGGGVHLAATVAGIALLTVLVLWFRNPLRHLPGPWHTVLTGVVLAYHTLSGRRLHYIHDLHLRYGRVVRVAPDEVDVSEAQGFQSIHRVGSGFLKSAWYTRFRPGALNIFNCIDPKVHSQRRRLLARPFSKSSLRQNWESLVADKARLAASQIRREVETAGKADIYKWFTLMATDVIGKLAFGEDFAMLETGQKNDFLVDLESLSKLRGTRAESGRWYPLIKLWRSGLGGNFEAAEQRVAAVCRRVVTNAHNHSLSKANIFGDMIARNDAGGGWEDNTISDADATFEAGALVVAGSGTTAVALTYLIWAVLKRPRVFERLLAELDTLPGDYTDAQLEELPYLGAVVEESLRLYGSAPGSLPRTVPESGLTLEGGHYIPPGYVVETQAYTIHRDSTMFASPESFLPDRWLCPPGDAKPLMCPFGAGSRVCLGIHLAYMELRHTVAAFFREMQTPNLAPSATDECMEIEHFFLTVPKGKKCEVTLGRKA